MSKFLLSLALFIIPSLATAQCITSYSDVGTLEQITTDMMWPEDSVPTLITFEDLPVGELGLSTDFFFHATISTEATLPNDTGDNVGTICSGNGAHALTAYPFTEQPEVLEGSNYPSGPSLMVVERDPIGDNAKAAFAGNIIVEFEDPAVAVGMTLGQYATVVNILVEVYDWNDELIYTGNADSECVFVGFGVTEFEENRNCWIKRVVIRSDNDPVHGVAACYTLDNLYYIHSNALAIPTDERTWDEIKAMYNEAR